LDELADDIQRHVVATLGLAGRLISLSKEQYEENHPDHAVAFNANVLIDARKRWYGDIDLTIDEPLLRELARRTGCTVSILNERDARFATENAPQLENAIYIAYADGRTALNPAVITRRADGRLRLPGR
jgi:hypothetical protein